MSLANPAADLERRKRLRIRLRPDLAIEEQKYEGKKFYVVKDPVSLRYYRLKDNEHFLLQFLDGKHTLEEAQKAYEREYRPERLRLEDLEGFAQQLLTAGLAMSDSPRAGKQLYERRGKRLRREWMQTLSNILYIKIPIFDPERVLRWMLKYVWWIFSIWFFTLSVGFMLAAILLVATHFDTFRSKLPSYHEFFSLKTAVYLWVALGVVKVIHEFGHGLSCKRFGGEVHEMGGLLMCFSPALYCNVSDAWVLPNKWHRIIISFAGIYVELIIAAIATFVWWNTPTQPFIHNLSLSLMIVCSVSTIVFNANPLMRYDGYYVAADWLEIPNLREKSNRYLQNLVSHHCLGVEIPPEEYMEAWRKVLFVFYAIVSYVYRWVVTFGILYLFWTFLRPYKLEVIGNLLTLASIASMTVWPAYQMIKNIRKRGRLPDMNRTKVTVTCTVLGIVLIILVLVPVPISRIRGLAVVQPLPDATSQVTLKRTAILNELKVKPGESVSKGRILATFRDPEMEAKLASFVADRDSAAEYIGRLQKQKSTAIDQREKTRIEEELAQTLGRHGIAEANIKTLIYIQQHELTLLAPRDGVIGTGPRVEDIGKMFEGGAREQGGQATPIFTIHSTDQLRVCMPLVTSEYNQLVKNLEDLKKESVRGKAPSELSVVLRVHGLDSSTWKGRISRLDESDAKFIPLPLSSRAGGPVPVHPPNPHAPGLVPQTQHYLIYVDIENPDPAIAVGSLAQVKIHCRSETCLNWAWRTVNNVFNLRLM